MLLSDLTKKEVIDVKANKVGMIVDVDLNVTQGTVAHYLLRTGVFKKVPLKAEQIEKIGEKVILKVTGDEIEGKSIGAAVS